MRLPVVTTALLIALPVNAENAGCASSPVTGCRVCWKGNISTKTCPNGDWQRTDWSTVARGFGGHSPRHWVIERYEYVIKRSY